MMFAFMTILDIFRYIGWFGYSIVGMIGHLGLLKTATEGAQTSIYCAVAKGIEPLSGKYFR